jgi:hypothetical protein
MRAIVGQTFPVEKLTGIVEHASPSGVVITFARVSSSGSTRTGVGDLTLIYPSTGSRQVRMMLAIRAQYQQRETLDMIRLAVFAALDIGLEESWVMMVAPECEVEYQSEPDAGYVELTS